MSDESSMRTDLWVTLSLIQYFTLPYSTLRDLSPLRHVIDRVMRRHTLTTKTKTIHLENTDYN